MFGRYHHGVKCGTHWRSCTGGGYLVGPVDTGDNVDGDDVVYIYPDMVSCIVGTFKAGHLTCGHFGHVSGIRREFGVVIPEVTIVPHSPCYRYDPSTSVRISSEPMTRDLYEDRHVYVAPSGVAGAGEGLWAKCFIAAGQMCAIFNGVRNHRSDTVP